MKKNEKGSLEIVLVISAIIIAAAAGVFIFISNSGDESSISETNVTENVSTEETSEADQLPVSDTAPSSGDYTVENLEGLAPICERQSFAKGLTKSESGTETAVLSNAADVDKFEYDIVQLASAYTPQFSSTEVDRVACVDRTETIAFENTCEINGSSFTHRGYNFEITVYDAHTQEVLGTGTATHSDDCPGIAAIGPNNVVDAVNLDDDAVVEVLESI